MQDSDQLQIDLESFPGEVRPMQAASAEAPFSSPEYLFEVKWDGLRCILFRDVDGAVRLQDRGLHDITADLPEVVAAGHYRCGLPGGHGAFRDFAEWILRLRSAQCDDEGRK